MYLGHINGVRIHRVDAPVFFVDNITNAVMPIEGTTLASLACHNAPKVCLTCRSAIITIPNTILAKRETAVVLKLISDLRKECSLRDLYLLHHEMMDNTTVKVRFAHR